MHERGRTFITRRMALVTLAVGLLTSYSHAQNKYAFVTSETTDGEITELALFAIPAANAICTRLARSVGSIIPAAQQADPWRAWLSDGGDSPDASFAKSLVPYILPNGTQVAASYAALISCTPTVWTQPSTRTRLETS